MLTALLTAKVGTEGWTHRPLRLAGARIVGTLDLEAATLTRPLHLQDCFFEQLIMVDDAEAITIRLTGCHLPGLAGQALHIRGDLHLDDGFTATGGVDLVGAHISGGLLLDGGTFTNEDGVALNGIDLVVGADMSCRSDFAAIGEVDLSGAHIGGNLQCHGGKFLNEGGAALYGSGLVVDRDLFCSSEFVAKGKITLSHARVGGSLFFDGGTLTNEGGVALNGIDLVVGGDLSCGSDFAAVGEVQLLDARIHGNLNCDGGSFTNEGGAALYASGLVVDRDMSCGAGFEAKGAVELSGAHVGGHLSCLGGTFTNEGGAALSGIDLVVGGDLFCGDGFAARGEIDLSSAHVGGGLSCDGSTLINEGGVALDGTGLVVDRDMSCGDKFTANGEVRLYRAQISGEFDCTGSTFSNPNGTALDLGHSEIGKQILLQPARLEGELSLRFARAGRWSDSARAASASTVAGPPARSSSGRSRNGAPTVAWPARGQLQLRGFIYDGIEAHPPVTVRARLEWLRRDAEGFIPQPYEQLAAVFRRDGNEHDARKVLISAQWQRRCVAANSWADRLLLRPIRVVWSALLWGAIGYGYRPWQILAPIALLFGFGTRWFSRAQDAGQILRSKDLDPAVHFNSARYTADLLIPGAGLGERSRFLPVGDVSWWATGYTIAGWVLAAMLIAGLTGVFRRL